MRISGEGERDVGVGAVMLTLQPATGTTKLACRTSDVVEVCLMRCLRCRRASTARSIWKFLFSNAGAREGE